MHRLLSLATLCIASLFLVGLSCDPAPRILVQSPAPLSTVTSCDVPVEFSLFGNFSGAPQAFLNFEELTVTEGPPQIFTATVPAEDLQDSNILLVKAVRTSDGVTVTAGSSFEHDVSASAYKISDPADLITGPLGHSRVGDYMLENCTARFAVQDGAQRDLYSVGQFGGNLIDAERVGHPGLDNFLELQPMVNVETVVNAQTVFVVNDGADGNPAVVRACGPDDLLDFVNPSSQVADAGLPFPANLNDNDQTIEGCTDYSLGVRDSHVAVTTTLTNTGASNQRVTAGDWMNQGGELDVMQTPNAGVGAALTNDVAAMAFYGVGGGDGVDYSYLSTPLSGTGSYVVISGVTVILHDSDVLNALLGIVPGTLIPPGQSYVMPRFFGVGEGSGSNAVDLDIEVRGLANARIEGCVTVGGAPAENAHVTVGTFDGGGNITDLATQFVTDAIGCYAGLVPVPSNPTVYGVVAAQTGVPYEGSALAPPVTSRSFSPGGSETVDFALPQTGALRVTVTDENSNPVPARVTVVGFDPSPPVTFAGPSLPGFGGSTLALFNDPNDELPFGLVRAVYTGADGIAEFDLEPGSYEIVASRGTEYSRSSQPVSIAGGALSTLNAEIVQVIDTAGFVSSDFHVHGINSADSKVSHIDRVEGYAGEGVDNLIMTDHHVHTDLSSTIAALGMGAELSSTVGEEITTFDYGHFNAYPLLVDANRISKGSTDWAVAAPAGADFPSSGAYNATPAEIFALATTGANSTVDTTVQVNHIGSHFEALKINTKLVPPTDALTLAERLERRLDEPLSTNLFFPFPALELWNGATRGAQSDFLSQRLGVWFNLLNQGIETTFIADTDSHRFTNLRMGGARTWTAAAPGSDEAGTVDGGEVARMVDAGKATGGQGIFITTQLRATDGSGAQADLTRFGSTHVSDAGGNVELDIRVQAPTWAPYDFIAVYTNSTTFAAGSPYRYTAFPSQFFLEGDCDPSTVGDGGFDIQVVNVAPGADRLETNITIPFSGLTQDTWFVVIAQGRDGTCAPMFPVFPADLASGSNATLADLLDGNVGESGVTALGASNALYYDN